MRLWSIHPKYLDARGLTALWREALLAQKVVQGGTRGYAKHPQLERFRTRREPPAALAAYLEIVQEEGERRGYRYDQSKIGQRRNREKIPVKRGQVQFEWQHLKTKLALRDPQRLEQLRAVKNPDLHPLFELVEGDVEAWERGGKQSMKGD